MHTTAIVLGLIAAAAAQTSARPTAGAGDLATALDARIRPWVDAREFSGVVLVARGDAVLFHRAYGRASFELAAPMALDTRLHLASVTKTFTAGAILLLAEAGALELDASVASFLPDYPRGDEITVRQLLAHQAGIPDHHGLPGFHERTRTPVRLADLVAWTAAFPLDFDPGTDNRYTNSGYALLARIAEVVTGQDFESFLRDAFLEPLGMRSTGELSGATAIPGLANGYEPGPRPLGVNNVSRADWSYAMGSGSLYSTTADLHRWLLAVDEERFFRLDEHPWPYGWGRGEVAGRRYFEQSGLHAGFTANAVLFPEEDLVVVTLANVLALEPWRRLRTELAAVVFGEELPALHVAPEVDADPAALASLAGRYAFDQHRTIELVRDRHGLWLVWSSDDTRHWLSPIAPGRLRLRSEGAELGLIEADGEAVLDWRSPFGDRRIARE